jgi:hypothetical protein
VRLHIEHCAAVSVCTRLVAILYTVLPQQGYAGTQNSGVCKRNDDGDAGRARLSSSAPANHRAGVRDRWVPQPQRPRRRPGLGATVRRIPRGSGGTVAVLATGSQTRVDQQHQPVHRPHHAPLSTTKIPVNLTKLHQ